MDIHEHGVNRVGKAVRVFSQPGEGRIAFLEVTATGNLMTTTIDSNGVSAHSRHTVAMGELLASQFYGTCVTKQ